MFLIELTMNSTYSEIWCFMELVAYNIANPTIIVKQVSPILSIPKYMSTMFTSSKTGLTARVRTISKIPKQSSAIKCTLENGGPPRRTNTWFFWNLTGEPLDIIKRNSLRLVFSSQYLYYFKQLNHPLF